MKSYIFGFIVVSVVGKFPLPVDDRVLGLVLSLCHCGLGGGTMYNPHFNRETTFKLLRKIFTIGNSGM